MTSGMRELRPYSCIPAQVLKALNVIGLVVLLSGGWRVRGPEVWSGGPLAGAAAAVVMGRVVGNDGVAAVVGHGVCVVMEGGGCSGWCIGPPKGGSVGRVSLVWGLSGGGDGGGHGRAAAGDLVVFVICVGRLSGGCGGV